MSISSSGNNGSAGGGVCSGKMKALNVIEPNRCIIEDLEILSFENEEQMNYYTIWHEALVDKRRELNAETERERQIIRNEIARKTRQLIGSVGIEEHKKSPVRSSRSKSSNRTITPSRTIASTTPALVAAAVSFRPTTSNQSIAAQSAASHQRQGSATLPNGLTVLNTTLPCGQQLLKYKLTKLYNKYRGRQMRRNFVLEKQRNAKIVSEIKESYLNEWKSYTALQALRLPETQHTLNTTTNNHTKILTPMAQPSSVGPIKKSKSSKKGKATAEQGGTQQSGQKPPLHLVYIDTGNIITYSNKINPQQVADYRRKSHLLPSSATSKKSSAASYDVFEIMNVLANTNKTNVTITRNANRPNQTGTNASIYSHSVNANTPGIVSTQLHLQARSYRDSVAKFYAEDAQRLEEEEQELRSAPSVEELVGKYLNLSNTYDLQSTSHNEFKLEKASMETCNGVSTVEDHSERDDELEKLEEDIRELLHQDTEKLQNNLQPNSSAPELLNSH